MSNAHFDGGYTYRARVLIHAPSYLYSTATVQEKLEGVGFTGVQCWKDKSGLPSDWPAPQRTDPSGFGQSLVWAQGTWSKESGDYPSKGSQWEIVDFWSQTNPPKTDVPTDAVCQGEGYACFPEQGYWNCCDGFECRNDLEGVYGGGQHCFPTNPIGVTELNAPTRSVASVVLGVGVAGAVGIGLWYAWRAWMR